MLKSGWYNSVNNDNTANFSVSFSNTKAFLCWYYYDQEGHPRWCASLMERVKENHYQGFLKIYSDSNISKPSGLISNTIGTCCLVEENGSIFFERTFEGKQYSTQVKRFMDTFAPDVTGERKVGWFYCNEGAGLSMFLEYQGNRLFATLYFYEDSFTSWAILDASIPVDLNTTNTFSSRLYKYTILGGVTDVANIADVVLEFVENKINVKYSSLKVSFEKTFVEFTFESIPIDNYPVENSPIIRYIKYPNILENIVTRFFNRPLYVTSKVESTEDNSTINIQTQSIFPGIRLGSECREIPFNALKAIKFILLYVKNKFGFDEKEMIVAAGSKLSGCAGHQGAHSYGQIDLMYLTTNSFSNRTQISYTRLDEIPIVNIWEEVYYKLNANFNIAANYYMIALLTNTFPNCELQTMQYICDTLKNYSKTVCQLPEDVKLIANKHLLIGDSPSETYNHHLHLHFTFEKDMSGNTEKNRVKTINWDFLKRLEENQW